MRDPMTSELRADVEMIAMSALLPIVEWLAMSALGHKRTFALQQSMSALLPKADMCGALAHVCFVPKADIAAYSISSSARVRRD